MYSINEVAIDNLRSLLHPGGESLILREDVDDPLRGFIYIELDTTLNEDKVAGTVYGLRLSTNTIAMDYECVSPDCIERPGIWLPIDIWDIDCTLDECWQCDDQVSYIQYLPYNTDLPHSLDDLGRPFRLITELPDQPVLPDYNGWSISDDIFNGDVVDILSKAGLRLLFHTLPSTTTDDALDLGYVTIYIAIECICLPEDCVSPYIPLRTIDRDGNTIFDANVALTPSLQDVDSLLTEAIALFMALLPIGVLPSRLGVHNRPYITIVNTPGFTTTLPPNNQNISLVRRYANQHLGFINTSKIINGSAYVIDVGFLHSLTNEPIFTEFNIGIDSNGQFISTTNIPTGKKIARLKRINYYDSIYITQAYYLGYTPILRRCSSLLPPLNNDCQQQDLESLSLSLINLLLGREINGIPCLYNLDIDAHIYEQLVRVLGLQDLRSSGTYGAIPRYFNTYTTANDLYGSNIESVLPFLEGVVDDECVAPWINDIIPSMEINNRAIGWFLLAMVLYREIINDSRLDDEMLLTANYLLGQRGPMGLVREGEDYPISTAIIVLIALLKLHDLTDNPSVLIGACSIKLAIDSLLTNRSLGTYYDSLDNIEPTADSILYGSLLSIFSGDIYIQELIAPQLTALGRPISNEERVIILTSNGKRVITSQRRYMTYRTGINTIYNPIIGFDCAEHRLTISKLINSHLSTLSSFNNHYYSSYKSQVLANRLRFSLVLDTITAADSDYRSPFLSIESMYDLERLMFYKNYSLLRLKAMTPTEFTWFSERALSENGLLGTMLSAISKPLAANFVYAEKTKRAGSLTLTPISSLPRWERDVAVIRHKRETYSSYKSRVSSRLAIDTDDEDSLLNSLESVLLVRPSILFNTYVAPNSYLPSFHTNKIGTGSRYIGPSKSLPTLHVPKRLDADEFSLLESIRPFNGYTTIRENIVIRSTCRSTNQNKTTPSIHIEDLIDIMQDLPNIDRFDCMPCYDCNSPYEPTSRTIKVSLDRLYTYPIYIYRDGNNLRLSSNYLLERVIGVIPIGRTTTTVDILL
jgi:hypothetical protein